MCQQILFDHVWSEKKVNVILSSEINLGSSWPLQPSHSNTCCRAKNILAEYHGESGSNAVHRLSEHEAAIANKNTGNAMAKHLALYHKEDEGDPDSFEYSVAATFKKNLERQISEAVSLKYSDPDIVMNQKNEHHGPAMHRTSTTRKLRNGS